ncbi:Protein W02D9.2 a [Aphelenchoides avenae]|nr:Protein W02D9.2 a [Aphelenchus avenae]
MSTNPHSVSLDLDLLEKEIEAKEHSRRNGAFADLSGQIEGTTPPKKPLRAVDLSQPDAEADFDTLDEPVWDTISRDLKLVSAKFAQVLVPPKHQENVLKDWDLWGPLFVCVVLSLLLQGSGKGPQFTEVFSLAFFGSCVVTANIKLLGGKISFFQALCVIGYCLLPAVFAAVACKFITITGGVQLSKLFVALKLLASAVGFAWSTYASMAFLGDSQPERRRFLAVYPIFLFYFVVTWLVLANS